MTIINRSGQAVTSVTPQGDSAIGGPPTIDVDHAGNIANFLGRFGLPALLLILVVFFSIMRPDSFATVDNYRSILDNQTIVVLLAFAAMIPLIVGQFDLSVASVVTMSHVFVVGFCSRSGLSPGLSIALTLGAMFVFGLVNGIIVVKLKVDAFIATLASSTVAGGIVLWYTGGRTLFDPVPTSLTDLARERVAGVPLPVIYVAVAAVAVWFVLKLLPLGRRMYATGGNPAAARLTGIPVERYVILSFAASATLAGLAGVVLGARLGTASPTTGGSLLLPAFAGAFLGATTVHPGRFNVVGTIVAVYTLAVTVSGLQQMGAPVWVEPVFNGLALVAAVALSGWAVRLRAERAKHRKLNLLASVGTVE